jgi:hypothetical protein
MRPPPVIELPSLDRRQSSAGKIVGHSIFNSFDMANMKTHLLYLVPQIARAMSLGVVLAYALPAHSADTPDYRCTQYERVVTIDDSGWTVCSGQVISDRQIGSFAVGFAS